MKFPEQRMIAGLKGILVAFFLFPCIAEQEHVQHNTNGGSQACEDIESEEVCGSSPDTQEDDRLDKQQDEDAESSAPKRRDQEKK